MFFGEWVVKFLFRLLSMLKSFVDFNSELQHLSEEQKTGAAALQSPGWTTWMSTSAQSKNYAFNKELRKNSCQTVHIDS